MKGAVPQIDIIPPCLGILRGMARKLQLEYPGAICHVLKRGFLMLMFHYFSLSEFPFSAFPSLNPLSVPVSPVLVTIGKTRIG